MNAYTSQNWISEDADQHGRIIALFRSADLRYGRSLLFIGRLILEVRNFIEHGTDEAREGHLRIHNEDFWFQNGRGSKALKVNGRQEIGRGQSVPNLDILKGRHSLLLIDGQSLKQCLTLCALGVPTALDLFSREPYWDP